MTRDLTATTWLDGLLIRIPQAAGGTNDPKTLTAVYKAQFKSEVLSYPLLDVSTREIVNSIFENYEHTRAINFLIPFIKKDPQDFTSSTLPAPH